MEKDTKILNEIENASELCKKHYTNEEILNVLDVSSKRHPEIDVEKQICILKMTEIAAQSEANALVAHLTGHEGLVREAAAIKVNEFMKNPKYVGFFQRQKIADEFLWALTDVNPNVCRPITEVLPLLTEKEHFKNLLYYNTGVLMEEITNLKRKNSHKYTKKIFTLYWFLEAFAKVAPEVDDRLDALIEAVVKVKDYTIREKLSNLINVLTDTSEAVEAAKAKLKRDCNYYVKKHSKEW